MYRTTKALLTTLLLVSPLVAQATVNEGVSYEGNDSNTSIQSEKHEASLSEKIDSPQANGEYYVANGAIKVTTDSENKLASVEVVDATRAVLTHVHVKAGNGFRCYESTDGFGASELYGNVNGKGKIQEISHITVFYNEVHVPEFVVPEVVIDHDHETDYRFELENPQPGQEYLGDDGKVKITVSEDGETYKVEVLDKCWDLEYIHDTEHRDVPDGTGAITDLPVNDKIIIYINEDETCKLPEEPTIPTEPQEPSEPQEPTEPSEPTEPQEPQEPVVPEEEPKDELPQPQPQEPVVPEPEEPKTPEFLPETGLEGIACALFGTGLVGLGVKLNKKRK